MIYLDLKHLFLQKYQEGVYKTMLRRDIKMFDVDEYKRTIAKVFDCSKYPKTRVKVTDFTYIITDFHYVEGY